MTTGPLLLYVGTGTWAADVESDGTLYRAPLCGEYIIKITFTAAYAFEFPMRENALMPFKINDECRKDLNGWRNRDCLVLYSLYLWEKL